MKKKKSVKKNNDFDLKKEYIKSWKYIKETKGINLSEVK